MANSHIDLVGNITRDPKISLTKENKKPKAFFSVAVEEGFGERQDTHFYPVVAYGTLAENIGDSIRKGNRVTVSGRLQTYKKLVEIDGEEKNIDMIQIVANNVGPDLRWSVAKVTKVDRSKDEDEDDSNDDSDEEEEAPKKKSKKSSAKSRAKAEAADDDDDDDDF